MNARSAPQASLHVEESVQLAAALTGSIANKAGLRCLFIKGPAAVSAGVRPARTSSDIDLLVHPSDVEVLLILLAQRGWTLRPCVEGMGIPKHSHSAYHPSWPCDIDIHFMFPGFEAKPQAAFEFLFENSTPYFYAGIEVRIPNVTALIVFQITHALRNLHLEDNFSISARSDYDFLLSRKGTIQWEDLKIVLDHTNTWASMKPFLLEAFPKQTQRMVFPEPSDDWKSRIGIDHASTRRAIRLIQAPWKEKPQIFFRALFPTRLELAVNNLEVLTIGNWPLARLRLKRFLRFIQNSSLVANEIKTVMKKSKRFQ